MFGVGVGGSYYIGDLPPCADGRVELGRLVLREMGGAPRKRFLVWIVKPSGRNCTDAFGGTNIVECRPL